jgi:hypothetical protein
MEKNYGRIALIPKGNYDSTSTYRQGDVVSCNGSSYIALGDVPTNTAPPNVKYWQVGASADTAIEKANAATTNANNATALANAAAQACEGALNGMNTMVDTVTNKAVVLGVESGILTLREA